MVSDDFSFPTITEPIPRFMGSPSLWNVSYEVFSDDSSYVISTTEREKEEEHHRRKGYYTKIKSAKDDGITKEDEERMDMLWENFNDELRRISSLDKNREGGRLQRKDGGDGEYKLDSDVVGDQKTELYCVKAWKMSKTSSTAILSPRKPSLLTMVKVVKKMLLLHNSHCHKKST
ncbi:uncharacterized protein LOC122654971 [Telopea speciosissima]|uniref:uncharacterized protein LOC122654971 n=1 Tax=Telopea speciosissima TaxID=54955 RepID=UPI001CC7D9DA|nr:uncharacterized protein LOC122654971 [Telopea speciosissima]